LNIACITEDVLQRVNKSMSDVISQTAAAAAVRGFSWWRQCT